MSSMLRNRLLLLLLVLAAVAVAAGCDNIGRAFDNSVDPSDSDDDSGISAVQIVPVGGDTRDGRPQVRAAYPEGDGWPASVPIVIEFSESINEATLLPTTVGGLDGRIGVRVQGTQQLLPAQYDVVANGRLMILRPVTPLTVPGAIYEVVLFPEGRDADGVRFQVTGDETILADFQTNQDEEVEDGRIVAIYPRDNFAEQQRESGFFVVFDKPANAGTIDPANLFLQQGGVTITAPPTPILQGVSGPDTRVVQLVPTAALAASARHEFTVTADVTFLQDGNLEFNGRTPFSVFDTVGVTRPVMVELGNPSAGFPNSINTANVLSPILNIELPADTLTGDLVVGRIYGGDAETTQTFDLAFVERTVSAPVDGAQTVQIEFGGDLGTVADPGFDDGDITFAAKIERGGDSSGFVQNEASADPIFDITPPTLTAAGPPGSGNDIYTDTEWLAFYGNASEELAAATLVDGVGPDAAMFASSRTGRFLMGPLALGRLTAPRGYTLTMTDMSGNLSDVAIAGNIVQRGQITGTLAGGLIVEAYDETTLLPIAGATVLVDPPTPTVPATGQLVGETDDAGRVLFTAGLGAAHTVTIIRAGYDLVTLYDTQAGLVSLPLRPLANGSSSLIGTVAETDAGAGETAIVGSTALQDRSILGVPTTADAPTSIPPTAILPNRAQVLTAFGGNFEPTAAPTFEANGCQICGPSLVEPAAPPTPGVPGEDVSVTIVMIPSASPGVLVGANPTDFGQSLGLDLANLVGGVPRVRVTASLQGFEGQSLIGVGWAVLSGGTTFDLDANFSLPLLAGLAPYSPASWLAGEAEDTAGRVSRVRVLLNPSTGTVVNGTGPSRIPSITAPGGPVSGSPNVAFVDAIDAMPVPGGFGMSDVIATDPSGRRWVVMVTDRDAAGATRNVQFPDLATPMVAGLDAGQWQVVVESRLAVSLTVSSIDDLVLTEKVRQEVNYVRSAPVTFTIQ